MKKRLAKQSHNYPNTFSQAWENELNRYMFGNLLAPFNYGMEFSSEFQFNGNNPNNDKVKKSDEND